MRRVNQAIKFGTNFEWNLDIKVLKCSDGYDSAAGKPYACQRLFRDVSL